MSWFHQLSAVTKPAEWEPGGVSAVQETTELVSTVASRLDGLGLLTTGGNLSVRTAPNAFAITQTGFVVDALARPEMLRLVDVRLGTTPSDQASREAPLHAAIYANFPELSAVCHAHPPATLAMPPSPAQWSTHTNAIVKCLPVHVIHGNAQQLADEATALIQQHRSHLLSPYGLTFLAPGHGLFTAAVNLPRALHLLLRIEENAQVASLRRDRACDD